MRGTFKPGDKLIIEKVSFNQLKKGDTIIFRRAREEQSDFIVHRVVGITSNGLVTRGDNCRERDCGKVIKNEIIGRVIRFDRWGKNYKTQNGWLGQLRAWALHGRIQIALAAKYLFRKPHNLIRKSGIIKIFWHPEIKHIHLETPAGPMVKYVSKDRTVAIHWISKNRWYLKRPYEFIIHS